MNLMKYFFGCLGGVLAGLLSTGHIMIIFMTLVSLTVRLLLQESSCNFFNNDESQGSSSRDFFHVYSKLHGICSESGDNSSIYGFFPITIFSLNVCVCVHVDAKHAKGDVSISTTKPRVNLKVRAGVIHAHDNTDGWVVYFLI